MLSTIRGKKMSKEEFVLPDVVTEDFRRFKSIGWSWGGHGIIIKPTENTIEYTIEGFDESDG